jgi:hypothetical protein
MFDITGYTLRTLFHSQIQEVIREAIRSTIQLTSLENQEQEDCPQTYKQGTIYEAQQDICYSSRDTL